MSKGDDGDVDVLLKVYICPSAHSPTTTLSQMAYMYESIVLFPLWLLCLIQTRLPGTDKNGVSSRRTALPV
jgi:hypothetical protein